METEAKPTGHIHAGTAIKAFGRYDRLLTFLRRHPGATTREIMLGADVCAVSALVSELRQMGFDIEATFDRVTDEKARVYRYAIIKQGQKELFA